MQSFPSQHFNEDKSTRNQHSSKFTLEKNVNRVLDSFTKAMPHKQPFFGQFTLGKIMSHANIHPGNRVLVYDESQGLVTASGVLSLEGNGDLYYLYKDMNTDRLAALTAINMTYEVYFYIFCILKL